jgi:hypothetical protein
MRERKLAVNRRSRQLAHAPSSFTRAAEIALAHADAALMQRMEESSFRQIWRNTNLLLKIKPQAREEERRRIPREPVMFMKEKQVSEELREFRWPQQKIRLLKAKLLTSVLIG